MRRYLMAGAMMVLAATPALAQEYRPFSPISGPNDAIPSPVCALINFGFCPQPPPPAPPFPNPNVAAVDMTPPPPPPPARHRHAHHRHVVPPAQ